MKKSRKKYFKNYRINTLHRNYKEKPTKEIPSEIPARYKITPTDPPEEQRRKNVCYKNWCWRSGVIYRPDDIGYRPPKNYTKKNEEEKEQQIKKKGVDFRTLAGLEEERDKLVAERLQTTDSEKWMELTSSINNIMVKLRTKKENRI